MEITQNHFKTKYSNGASVETIYHPTPHPKFHYADRIELSFKTQDKQIIGTRMTFAEAMVVIKQLSMALDAFLDDKSNNPNFDIPLEAN